MSAEPYRTAPPEVPRATPLATELAETLRLALPIALSQLALMAMGLVDTAIVGRASEVDLAGASLGNTVVFAIATFAMGITAALEPLAAQAFGAGEPGRAWSALGATARAALWVALPSALVSWGAVHLLPWLGVPAAVAAAARANVLARLPTVLLFPLFLAGKTYLQALGRTTPAVLAALAANAINLVVCSALVLGDRALAAVGLGPRGLPALGAFGAGLANSIGSLALALMVFAAAWRARPGADARGLRVSTRAVMRLGVPAGLQMLAEAGAFSVASLMVGRFGARVVSAHHIALSLASFTFMGALGVGGAAAVRVGRAVGAGASPRRAGLVGIGVAAGWMTLAAATFALAPRALARVFTSSPDVVETTATLLGIAAVFQLFDGVQCVAAATLRGAGDTRAPFAAMLLAYWVVALPLAAVLDRVVGLGVRGVWWGLTAGLVLVAAALTARFVWLTRKHIARV